MKLTDLHLAIMSRDKCLAEEADNLVKGMRNLVRLGEDPEEVLFAEGFEPDYVFDLL